jgi:hypothetical protein
LAERESTYEDSYSSDNGVEEIESSDSTNANEVKQGAFDTQVSEGLMQALEYSVCPSCLRLHVCHTPLSVLAVMGG